MAVHKVVAFFVVLPSLTFGLRADQLVAKVGESSGASQPLINIGAQNCGGSICKTRCITRSYPWLRPPSCRYHNFIY